MTKKSAQLKQRSSNSSLLKILLLLVFTVSLSPQKATKSWAGPRAILEGTYPLSSLQVLGECVNRLKERYFDPDRINPREMVSKAVESLQNHVTPLFVEEIRKDEDSDLEAILIRMDDEERRIDLSEVKDLDRMVWTLMNAFQFIDAHLPPGADRENLESIATNAMLHTLDPHTTFLDPGSYRDMQVETSGLFGGLGIVISLVKGELTVINVMEETPAFRAGLNPRDKVVQIDDESTVNMDLSEAVSRMRGKPGTDVTIRVLRKGWEEPKPFTITRARITIRSVVSKRLDGDIGYVRLKNFRANTAQQLQIHLKKLESEVKAPLEGVILDLRDDPGGFLEQAIRVADHFLKKGEIVRTIGAGNKVRDNRSAKKNETSENEKYEKIPLIVLINPGSASASEIVAGALKNHNRALIIGNKSFGKGTVQGIYELGDGAVKITIAEYLTPGGVPVHEVGVIPDIAIEGIDTALESMMIFSQGQLAHDDPPSAPVGTARWKAQQTKPRRTMRFVMKIEENDEEAQERRRFEYDVIDEEDFSIDLAANLLRGAPDSAADVMMRNAKKVLRKFEKREARRLEEAMKAHGVDWSGGPEVDRPRVSATVTMTPKNGEVKAGEELKITVQVQNNGLRPLYRIHGIADSTTRLLEGREFLFGKIAPGAKRSWTTTVEPHSSSYERFDTMKIDFFQDTKPIGLNREFLVGVRTPPRPDFEFTYLIDDQKGGNGDGRVQIGERVSLNIMVRNRGEGATNETTAALKNSAGEGVFLERGRRTVDAPIAPNHIEEFSFTFDVRPSLTTSRIPLELQIRDRKNGISFQERFSLPVHSSPTETIETVKSPCMAKQDLSLHGGASTRFPVLAHVKKHTALDVIRSSGRWMLVQDKNKVVGWARSSQLDLGTHQASLAKPAQTFMAFRPPMIEIGSPVGKELFTSNTEGKLKGRVRYFGAKSSLERTVTVFQDGRKIWFETRRHTDDEEIIIPLDLSLKLKEGQNRISIRAKEGDRVDMYETLFIHRGTLENTP